MPKLGLIGAGKHGSRYLNPDNGGEVITRVLTRSDHPALKAAAPWAAFTTDINEFFDGGLDGVIIATPPESHCHLAIRALRMGSHVLCEKPLALSGAEVGLMIACARESNKALLGGHTYLFDEAFEVQLAERPETPKSVQCLFGGRAPERTYSDVLDWGPHLIAIASATRSYSALEGLPFQVHGGPIWTTLQIGDDLLTLSSTTDTPRRWLEIEYPDRTLWSRDFREPGAESPMKRMLDVFNALIEGGSDPRAALDFTHNIYSVLFSLTPESSHGRTQKDAASGD